MFNTKDFKQNLPRKLGTHNSVDISCQEADFIEPVVRVKCANHYFSVEREELARWQGNRKFTIIAKSEIPNYEQTIKAMNESGIPTYESEPEGYILCRKLDKNQIKGLGLSKTNFGSLRYDSIQVENQ